MIDLTEIKNLKGRTISRYEWNRLYECYVGRFFRIQQHFHEDTSMMQTNIFQSCYEDSEGHIREYNGGESITFDVRWNDLYKRKLLLLKSKN